MKPTRKINKPKATLDLPTQRVRKKVKEYENKKLNCPIGMGNVLDQAFALLLDQLIRQN